MRLTDEEMLHCGIEGLLRRIRSIRKGSSPTHGLKPGPEEWGIDIEGSMYEYAAAKELGVFWKGLEGPGKVEDIGGYHVRGSRHLNGHLTLHKSDPDGVKFLLVTGEKGHYIVRGWMTSTEGKNDDKYWKTSPHGKPVRLAYFVPQSDLHPLVQDNPF